MTRIEQPPLQPALRSPERHDFWTGLVLALIGLLVALCGARHLTGVDTTDGRTAWEVQLVKACSSGGIQWVDTTIPTSPPPDPNDPEALARAQAQQDRQAGGPRWKVRVDTGANARCPT